VLPTMKVGGTIGPLKKQTSTASAFLVTFKLHNFCLLQIHFRGDTGNTMFWGHPTPLLDTPCVFAHFSSLYNNPTILCFVHSSSMEPASTRHQESSVVRNCRFIIIIIIIIITMFHVVRCVKCATVQTKECTTVRTECRCNLTRSCWRR